MDDKIIERINQIDKEINKIIITYKPKTVDDIISKLLKITLRNLIQLIKLFKRNPQLLVDIKMKYNSMPAGGAGFKRKSPTLTIIDNIIKKRINKTHKTTYKIKHKTAHKTTYKNTINNIKNEYLNNTTLKTDIAIFKDSTKGKNVEYNTHNIDDAVIQYIGDIDYMDDTGIYSDLGVDLKRNGDEKMMGGYRWSSKCEYSRNINNNYRDMLLKIIDTYHDFWSGAGENPLGGNTTAGTDSLTSKMKAQLKKYLTDTCANYIYNNFTSGNYDISKTHDGSISPINLKHVGNLTSNILRIIGTPNNNIRSIELFEKLVKSVTKRFFNKLIGKNMVGDNWFDINIIEKSTIYGIMCIPEPIEIPSKIKNTRPNIYIDIISNIFTSSVSVNPDNTSNEDIYYICDAGSGPFGLLGNFDGSRLRQIITQCTVADSANTEKIIRGDTSISENERSIYEFVQTEDDGRFKSDSNTFTESAQRGGYHIYYNNSGFSLDDPYGIVLQIEFPSSTSIIDERSTREFKFGYNESMRRQFTQGPSASLLSAYFFKASNRIRRTGIDDTIINKIENAINNRKGGSLELGNLADIYPLNPGLFLDIKRGGDRDQVMAAYYLKSIYPRLIFCTGDELCATIAVRLGLPTIYQTKAGIVKYWKEGVGMVREIDPPIEPMEPVETSNETMRVNLNTTSGGGKHIDSYVNILHFIQNIAAHAAYSARSNITRGIGINDPTNIIYSSTVQNIQNLIDNYYDTWDEFKESTMSSKLSTYLYKYIKEILFDSNIYNSFKINLFYQLYSVLYDISRDNPYKGLITEELSDITVNKYIDLLTNIKNKLIGNKLYYMQKLVGNKSIKVGPKSKSWFNHKNRFNKTRKARKLSRNTRKYHKRITAVKNNNSHIYPTVSA
jgi:hypothetical protein